MPAEFLPSRSKSVNSGGVPEVTGMGAQDRGKGNVWGRPGREHSSQGSVSVCVCVWSGSSGTVCEGRGAGVFGCRRSGQHVYVVRSPAPLPRIALEPPVGCQVRTCSNGDI